LPFGLLYKFVIVFVTPYFFARETPVSEKTLYLHSLTHTSLWLGYVCSQAFVFHQGNSSLIKNPLPPIPLDSYKLYILTTPCPALYGSVVTVTFHSPVSNNLASRRPLAAFGAAFTKPLLIPSVSLMAARHCVFTFLSVIVLNTPSSGTRRHIQSFLIPVSLLARPRLQC
jgi:hypothetical protein